MAEIATYYYAEGCCRIRIGAGFGIWKMEEEGKRFRFSLTFFQSNHEGEIIDKIQEGKNFDGIIINPGGYSHTSVSIMDAIRSIDYPCY